MAGAAMVENAQLTTFTLMGLVSVQCIPKYFGMPAFKMKVKIYSYWVISGIIRIMVGSVSNVVS